MLKANALLFETLLEDFPDMIQSVDSEGRIVYANRKATELTGYSNEQLLQMNIRQLYAPELLNHVETGFQKLQKRGELSVCESVVLDKEGSRITVEIRSFAVYDKTDKFLRTFSILRDIRSVKQMQDNLMHASRLAAVGKLASSIVHDITNPLSVIKLSGEMLQMELEQISSSDNTTAENLRQSVGSVDRAVSKIEKLVNHLRNMARTNAEKPGRIDLKAVMNDAIFMVRSKLRDLGIEPERTFPEDQCLTLGYDMQLEQVFMNLLSNSCDAMNDLANPRLSIRITGDTDSDGDAVWKCTVEDNGTGISEEDREQIFESFFSTKDKDKGTGLGLAISQSIVHSHGGSIEVYPREDGGTAFNVSLPVSPAI